MALPIINFASLPTQGDPRFSNILDSLAKGIAIGYMPREKKADLQSRNLSNQLSRINLKYAAPMAENQLRMQNLETDYYPRIQDSELDARNANLESKNLSNQLARINLKYSQPMAENELRMRNLQADYYPKIQDSELNARNANTELIKKKSEYMPMDEMIKISNQQRISDRFGSVYQLSSALKNMSPSSRDMWISQHPEEYLKMVNSLANQFQQEKINNKNLPFLENSSPDLKKIYEQMYGGQPLTLEPDDQQKQSLINSGIASIPDKFQTSADDVEQIRRSSLLSANKELTSPATRHQLEGAIQVESIMNDPGFQKRAINASQYAGAYGQGKKALDAFTQRNPESYNDYLTFMNQDMTLLKNRIKTLDQMGATDSQREELDSLYKKSMDSISSNPSQFLSQINSLGKSLDNISRSVQKSSSPVGEINRLEGYKEIGKNNSNKKNISEESINYTAKKYGISVGDVRRMLGVG